jgi:protocatechuate 3,4-dioxygenase beta subunit
MPGATVTAGGATAQTDASGVARFAGLAPGTVQVYATAPKAIRSHAAAVTVS